MSQRGRGPGPDDDEAGEDDTEERGARRYPLPPGASRTIAPYDPYRSSPGGGSHAPVSNPDAEVFASPRRPGTGSDRPFLPDDDPLNADAWQLDQDEDAAQPEFDQELPPSPRPRRRPGAATRVERESEGASGRAPRRSRGASESRRRAPRPAVSVGVPRAVAESPLVADQTALILLGINVASIIFMALVLSVRLGGMPSPMVLQLDAAGQPDRWGPPGVLWRLPVMSFFITLMFLVVAWFLHPLDRFAARFALGATIVAQLIAWAAVILQVT
jgi:hypothetical protein